MNWMQKCIGIMVFAVSALPGSISHARNLTGLPPLPAQKVNDANGACADFEDGTFAIGWGQSAASPYGGTRGCESRVLAGNTVTSLLDEGRDVVTLGRNRVLPMDVHGSRCGGVDTLSCVAVLVRDQDAGTWRSVQPATKQ